MKKSGLYSVATQTIVQMLFLETVIVLWYTEVLYAYFPFHHTKCTQRSRCKKLILFTASSRTFLSGSSTIFYFILFIFCCECMEVMNAMTIITVNVTSLICTKVPAILSNVIVNVNRVKKTNNALVFP